MRSNTVKSNRPNNTVFKRDKDRPKIKQRNPLTKEAMEYKDVDPEKDTRSIFKQPR